jgi:Kef-type K+ transport system membrane component KefB
VLLLFVIGLELQPSRLWVLRRSVFGLGCAQVLVTGAPVGAIALALGLSIDSALVIGLGLAMALTPLAFAFNDVLLAKRIAFTALDKSAGIQSERYPLARVNGNW